MDHSAVSRKSQPKASADDRDIVITRLFNHPREKVFKAWTNPDHIGEWWGPRGFSTTTRTINFQRGGTWNFVMHGPDGKDYENRITFEEIKQPERLVYMHGGDGETENIKFQVTVTFDDESGKTRLTMRSRFESTEERDRVVREYGAIEGGHQTLDRLEEYLAEL